MQNKYLKSEPRGASELIEVPIASGASGQISFPDVPQLRNQGGEVVILKAMRLITAKVLSHAPTTGVAVTPIADLRKMSIILYSNGWEKGHLIPALVLNDVQDQDSTAATTIPFRENTTYFDNWQDVDWNKSKVQFSNGQTAAGASTLVFEVEYQRFLISNGQLIATDK